MLGTPQHNQACTLSRTARPRVIQQSRRFCDEGFQGMPCRLLLCARAAEALLFHDALPVNCYCGTRGPLM